MLDWEGQKARHSRYMYAHIYMYFFMHFLLFVHVHVWAKPMSAKKKNPSKLQIQPSKEKMGRIPMVRPLAAVNYKTINQNVAPN